MRLCVVLVLLTVTRVRAVPRERHYYIAAVEIDWNYSDTNRFGPTYKKVVFREYEKDFRQAKTHPSWLGLLGPTLRAEEGETIVVTFRNMATGPHSIHPHGVAYGKQSEGAHYFDNTSQKEKEDDVVQPNSEHVYYWEVTPDVSPRPDDPTCLTHTYISHQNVVQDYNSGLIGALLICKPGSLDESGMQNHVHQEYVFLFGVFDEGESKYQPRTHGNHVKYTINGYAAGTLPDVSMCAYSSVSLHLLGMSSEPEVFSVHMNGQVLEQNGHKMSSVGLISGSSTTASLVPLHLGRWMLSSHTIKHMEVNLHGFVDVKKCVGFNEPRRRMTVQQKKRSREWQYFIAAEEVVWDYAPNRDHIDNDFKLEYLTQSSKRIGGKYKKAVYTMYSNESFTERSEVKKTKNEFGILGPVIRAQIRDVIKIVFKNMASRPYSIYPHGLSIAKSEEGANYPAGGNQSHGVQPGETRTYIWRVLEEDEPLDGDSRCLTRMYHSAVDTPRDIASGLIGPILICKSESLDVRNVQLKADKEQHAMFAVFDENKSWYVDDNIRKYCDRSKVNKADPDFYKSNVMHTINGYVFESGPLLGFCNGEVATWHISSIGAQDYIQTATFYGHPFGLNERTEDFLSLYPMTGETITMNMDNIGVWLLASLNTHETTKGMRVKFQDVECFRDYQYEYEDYGDSVGNKDFTVWNPASLDDIKKEEQKPKPAPAVVDVDDLTALYAEELGLRSLKNQSGASDVEQLDLSFLDYDTAEPHRDNTSLHFNDTKSNSENSTLKLKSQNETSFWEDVDASNLTAANVTNQSVTGNNTHLQNSSLSSATDSSFVHEIENTTTFYNLSVSQKDDNLTTNNSTPVASGPDDVEVSLTKNTTVTSLSKAGNASTDTNNATSLSKVGNASTDTNNMTTLSKAGNASTDTNNATSLSKVGNASTDTNMTTLSKAGNASTDTNNMTTLSKAGNASTDTNMTTLSKVGNASTDTNNMTTLSKAGNASTDNINNINISLTVSLEETTNLTVTISGSSPSILETGRMNETLTGDNLTSVDFTVSEDSEERLSRGDVFSYSVPVNNSSNLQNATQVNATSLSNSTQRDVENNTANVNVSADGRDPSLSVSAADVEEMDSLTIIELESSDNKTFNNAADLGYELQISSSETVTIPSNTSLENVTELMLESGPVENITVNISGSNSSDSRKNVTSLPVQSNRTSSAENEQVLGGFSISAELTASESSEEFFIYLKENNTEGIKTTSVKTQGHNWTYDATHQTEPMEIPDYMMKYFKKETPRTPPAPKKRMKKVNLRQRPQKGHSMKTKKKKEYKPQAKSGVPFSPRGFNPAMTPRGSRPSALQPISDEENLINMPVVIGVPRPDFSDYELYVPGEDPQHLELNEQDVKANEYEYVSYKDPYSSYEDVKNYLDETTKNYFKYAGPNTRLYFIAAEEVEWDYAGYGQRREDKSQLNSRVTKFTKVVFRSYKDSSFSTPDIRGEIDEHLGILGPVIKAEVGQSIMVVFRNNANRPYSLHPNGVTYTKQTEGLSYEDGSKYWFKYDNEVQPNTTFTYIWKVSSMVGPSPEESHCRTWAYYSGVNPERDIHSGLIGPLLVCREGTLSRDLPDMREFTLLFMTFDESRSWYFEKNSETMLRKTRRRLMDSNFMTNLKFHSINGIIFNLKGLRMYTNQLVCWHLINMGSPNDFQSIHFHGQTFIHKKTKSYRQSVHPLLPGSFATLEMYPSKPGLWQLETEIGLNQQKGMQTLFLVLDNDCYRPLGLESGSVKDSQITATNTRGYWEPHLARLNNQGKYNAWSTEQNHSWIQVDFQRPVVISQVATQGARQMFYTQFVVKYLISYSTDRRNWIFYKGDSRDFRKVFTGNQEAYETKKNTFFPPLIGRFVRLHPVDWYNKPTVRMEFYGCELDGCSVPLGMESGLIGNDRIKASSIATSWYSGPWAPSLARLNKQGTINAWQAKYNDMNQWIQVELPQVKKITGIITQGAKALSKEMYVMSYVLQYSSNGLHWEDYTDDEAYRSKTFIGNTNNNDHVKNYIYPPIFSRFIRILPKSWMVSITMRIELLGCDFE